MIRRVLESSSQPSVLIALMIGDLLVNAAATQEQLREHFDDLRLQESLRGWIIRKAEHRLPKYGPAVLYGAVAVRSFLTDLRRA